MNGNAARFVQFGAGLVALVTLGWVMTGQAAKPAEQGIPTDWTHQHVVFSRPATAERAQLVERDPRYWHQWYRDNIVRVLSVDGARPDATSMAFGSDRAVDVKMHRDWSENMGAGATVGAGNYPAKYSFGISTANCASAASPDFVVFSTGLQSAGTVASVVAYDNLYSGCSGPVPQTYFAYNTTATAAGTIKTSPVLSLDGSQFAFVQTDGLHGAVILLKWAANTGTLASPVTPSLVTLANYSACTAPCMTKLDLRTALGVQTNDITSSVYYDYTGDIAWVGDSLGLLHQFHPFFNGTPAEVTSPWPVQVNPLNPTALSSPVFDHVSGNVFVGDAGGFVERVSATTGVATVSAQVDHGTGIVAPPVVDKTIGKVYVYSSSNGVANCGGVGKTCAAVYQFSTSFASGNAGSQTTVGAGGTTNPLYAGGFDSVYRTSAGTGNLYVCGNTGANPTLYQIKINNGSMPAAGAFLASVTSGGTAACSPVTDFLNPNLTGGAEERLFVSAALNGRASACANKGCVESFIDMPWKASTSYVVGQEILAGTHIQVAIQNGTSGTTTPAWTASTGHILTDGTVQWLDQGLLTAGQLGIWSKGVTYTVGTRIVDSNRNIEIVTTAGTTGATVPTWSTTPGTNTTDNTVTYINAGALPTAALQTSSGTSGVIIDNSVGSGTMAGASQVYFSTLGDQICTTSGGTGGCAVQASQSALK